MKKAIVFCLLVIVVTFSLGCIAPPPEEGITIRFGYQPSTHQVAFMVAMEEGWWQNDLARLGVVCVTEAEFPSGPPEMQAMLAGDIDVAYVGATPPITAIDKGLKAKIVAGVQINGSHLVVKPELAENLKLWIF